MESLLNFVFWLSIVWNAVMFLVFIGMAMDKSENWQIKNWFGIGWLFSFAYFWWYIFGR